jgi:acetylornithine deacetylase
VTGTSGHAAPPDTTGMPPQRSEALRLLADLIGFPTVTGTSNLDLIAYVEDVLAPLGARMTRTYDEDRNTANLLATIGPNVDGGVVLSGHTDVVPAGEDGWTGAPFLAAQREGRIYGRGAVDMKGFIACALAMAPRFASADLPVPIHVALTFDEEIGCLGAPLLIGELARTGPRPTAAIVGEPTSMGIVYAHKGCYEHTTTIVGVEGHGSAPDRGVNAVETAAAYIAHLGDLADHVRVHPPADSPFDPPGSTINVGTIEGGTARNVVSGRCTIEWEFRTASQGDADAILATVAAYEEHLRAQLAARDPAATIETATVGSVGGLDPEPGSAAVALVRELLGDEAGPLRTAAFSTEAGLYQAVGIPAVVCGPGSIDVAHRPDEYVELDQLDACLTMLDDLAERLASV